MALASGNGRERAIGGHGHERVNIHHVISVAPVFAKASKTSRDVLTEHARFRSFPEGAVLIEQEARASEMGLLVRGAVQLWRKGPFASYLSLGILGPGDSIGVHSIFQDAYHTETATALETTDVLLIGADVLQSLTNTDTGLCTSLRLWLLHERKAAEGRIASQLFRTVEGRLSEFLLQSADRFGTAMPEGTRIDAPLTHLEIARHIGSTRETVTLTLGSLKREGVLKAAGRRLIVANREALAQRAQ